MFFDNNNSIEQINISEYLKDINNDYNAIIEAAKISELRYYKDTGKDLFIVNESAFKNFLDKIIEFFKKIKEKIKEIFYKFMDLFDTKKYKRTTDNWEQVSRNYEKGDNHTRQDDYYNNDNHTRQDDYHNNSSSSKNIRQNRLPDRVSNDDSSVVSINGYDFSNFNWNPFEDVPSIIDANKASVKTETPIDVQAQTIMNRNKLLKNFKDINTQCTNIGDELEKEYLSPSNLSIIKVKDKSEIDNLATKLKNMENVKKQYKKLYMKIHSELDRYIMYLEDQKKDVKYESDGKMKKAINDNISVMKNLFTDCTSLYTFIGKCYKKYAEQLNALILKATAKYNS